MGKVIDFETGKTKEESIDMEKRKPTIKEMEARIKQLETIVGQFQGAVQSINGEIFQNNANAIALFRSLEAKGIIGEDDIKESWQKHIVEPYEQGQEEISDEMAEESTSETTEGILEKQQRELREKEKSK